MARRFGNGIVIKVSHTIQRGQSMQNTSKPDSHIIDLKEGMHITFERCTFTTPRSMFILALTSSASLGGKPVHCAGLLPGVSLRIQTSHDRQHMDQIALRMWEQIYPLLDQWIEVAEQHPCVTLSADRTDITLALDSRATLDKGVLQFSVTPFWAGSASDSYSCAPMPD
jgi:hypothetical protein